MAIVAAISFAGFHAFMNPAGIQAALAATNCPIKGNISYNGGQRIYHVPGQHYYAETVIDSSRGERWFCSEGEARAAGWRRAGY